MSNTPYVPFFTSDFLAGTSGMTAATKGVYITLLCLMYEEEGPLPQKWDTLARRCGCTLPAFKRAISDMKDDGKVYVTDAGIWSEKCDKHITQRRERSSSGKAAAKKRWQKSQQKQGGDDANASSPQCQPDPEPDPYKENKFSLCEYDQIKTIGERYAARYEARRMDRHQSEGNVVPLPPKLERAGGGHRGGDG